MKWLGILGVMAGIAIVVAMVWTLANPPVVDDPAPPPVASTAVPSTAPMTRPAEPNRSRPISQSVAVLPVVAAPRQPSKAADGPRHLGREEMLKLVDVHFITQVQQGAMKIQIRNLCSEPLRNVHVAMVYKDPQPEKEYDLLNVPGRGWEKVPRNHEAEFSPHDFPLLGPGQSGRCSIVRLGRDWELSVEGDIDERPGAPARIIFAKER